MKRALGTARVVLGLAGPGRRRRHARVAGAAQLPCARTQPAPGSARSCTGSKLAASAAAPGRIAPRWPWRAGGLPYISLTHGVSLSRAAQSHPPPHGGVVGGGWPS
jgi:hypothetical protein